MPKTIEVFPAGTAVLIGPEKISGTVEAAIVGHGLQVQYHIVWWDGRVRRAETVHASEVKSNDWQHCHIGFLNGEA